MVEKFPEVLDADRFNGLDVDSRFSDAMISLKPLDVQYPTGPLSARGSIKKGLAHKDEIDG